MASDVWRIPGDLPRRRVLVVSDRYPPDTGGGAELSLHLLLREPDMRDEVLVVTFDRTLARPARRSLDGVEILALPSPAAWPLHRLSQTQVERLKRLPFRLKWARYWAEAALGALGDPAAHLPALRLRLAGAPAGGVPMDQATTPETPAVRALASVTAQVRPELVHADNARAILLVSEALKDSATPWFAVVRDHRFTTGRFDQRPDGEGPKGRAEQAAARALAYRQAALRRARLVVATSRHMESALRSVVDPSALRRTALVPVVTAESAAPQPEGGFRVLVVGALNPNKGQAHFLEALPNLAAQAPKLSIDIVGSGPDEAQIVDLARRHASVSDVRMHGRVPMDALAALYAACDVVALPTLWAEPFGRVPLEAGAAGKPVVAYASGGLVETIEDGVTGLLVPTGDRAGFVAALATLAANPALRARMGEEGRRRAAAFAPVTLAARLRALWDETARR